MLQLKVAELHENVLSKHEPSTESSWVQTLPDGYSFQSPCVSTWSHEHMTGCITARAHLAAQPFDNRVAFSTSRSIQAACRAMHLVSLLATRDCLQARLQHRDPKHKRPLYQRCHSQAPMASCAALGRCTLRWMKVVANKWCKTCLSLDILT